MPESLLRYVDKADVEARQDIENARSDDQRERVAEHFAPLQEVVELHFDAFEPDPLEVAEVIFRILCEEIRKVCAFLAEATYSLRQRQVAVHKRQEEQPAGGDHHCRGDYGLD